MRSDLTVGGIEFSIFYDEFTWGDGNHETTKFIMELIIKYGVKNKSVIDIGAGTGILSVLCGKLGARAILALELNRYSMGWIVKNISENSINVDVKCNDLTDGIDVKADIVLANLPVSEQIKNVKTVAKNLNNDGLFIMSWWNKLKFEDYVKGFKIMECIKGNDYDAYVLKKER